MAKPVINYLYHGDDVAVWVGNKQIYYYNNNLGEVLHAIFSEIGGTVNSIDEDVEELINDEAFISSSIEGLDLSELNEGILRVKKAKLQREILILQSKISDKLEEIHKLDS